MSIYGKIIQFNAQTGAVEFIDPDNEWVLANKSSFVALALSKASITADGVDSAVLSAQLKTPLLIDGAQDNLSDTLTVTLLFGEEAFELELIGGYGQDTITALAPSSYVIYCDSLPSNYVTLEAV